MELSVRHVWRSIAQSHKPLPCLTIGYRTERQGAAERKLFVLPYVNDMRQEMEMYVFEIITPGTWLDYEDREWSWKIQNQLRSLESQFFEANGALNLFMQTQVARPAFAHRDNWEQDSRRRSEIQRALEQERGDSMFHDSWDTINFETEVRFKREQWSKGRVPRKFEHNRPFIYARAFLYALDAFDKFLGVLAKEPNVPEVITKFHTEVAEAFPDLRGVRNTNQHLEDRSRGLGAGQKPKSLDLKPITNNFINAPGGGVLVLNCLNGSRYGSTMSDGHYGEIDVAYESMQHLQPILEGVLGSFKWHGPQQHAPSL